MWRDVQGVCFIDAEGIRHGGELANRRVDAHARDERKDHYGPEGDGDAPARRSPEACDRYRNASDPDGEPCTGREGQGYVECIADVPEIQREGEADGSADRGRATKNEYPPAHGSPGDDRYECHDAENVDRDRDATID